MPDTFTKARRSEVRSRISATLRQPPRRGGETAPGEAGAQRVGAIGLVENPALCRGHVAHGLFQHAGGVGLVAAVRRDFHGTRSEPRSITRSISAPFVQAIPHAPRFGSTASRIKGNVSIAARKGASRFSDTLRFAPEAQQPARLETEMRPTMGRLPRLLSGFPGQVATEVNGFNGGAKMFD